MLTTGKSVVSEERRVDDKRGGFPATRKLPATFSTRSVQMHFFFPCSSPLSCFSFVFSSTLSIRLFLRFTTLSSGTTL